MDNYRQANIDTAKKLLKDIEEMEISWNKHHTDNNFNNSFWRLDGALQTKYYQMKNLPFCTYPITSVSELKEYIEFQEDIT